MRALALAFGILVAGSSACDYRITSFEAYRDPFGFKSRTSLFSIGGARGGMAAAGASFAAQAAAEQQRHGAVMQIIRNMPSGDFSGKVYDRWEDGQYKGRW